MGAQGSIEYQVILGLQTAESQANKLRELLTKAVKVDSNAFKGLDTALNNAEKQIAKLKSEMSSAFQSVSGSKKFLGEYDKLFESLSTIGNRFSFLKEADLMFSPEGSAELKNMRSELEALGSSINQIKSGKVGKLFEDDSVASIQQVRQAAEMVNVTLSKTTFQDFKQKLSGAMTETAQKIEDTRKQIELLNQSANNASLKRDSVFSQANIDKLAANTGEVLTSSGAAALRQRIKALYEEFNLSPEELGKNIKTGGNLDAIFIQEQEKVTASVDKYVSKLEEERQKIQDEIDKFGDINKNTADGSRANWESKLAYIDQIKEKFHGLINFSDAKDYIGKNGAGINTYVKQIEQELKTGLEQLNVQDIARLLQIKLQESFNGISTKQVITDFSGFKSSMEIIMRQTFQDLNLGDVTAGIGKGWDFDKAIEMVMANIQTAIAKIDPSELEGKLERYKAALETLRGASATVGTTEATENAGLKDKEQAYDVLTQKILDYVNARLSAIRAEAGGIGQNDKPQVDQTRSAIEQYITSLSKLQQKQQTLGNVQMAINRWMGFYQVLNLTKRAINDMKQHIQELDTVMTQIAVVTNMSQEQLWGQISKYSEIARQYGVAIKGVYEVSQIYYQQGLESNDVMTLTTETLKMARIAGLDYATAADYMTTAIRGFKMEMTDAAHVTDVFSALAANTASSTEELAVAISKTAASAANVGSSFEATSAMMATMIATTRESATNIGTALKSIISRYGEMKANPEGKDAEGEEYSLNKVDTALQTIGVSIHTVTGEFRDFDDVILELAEKWDTLDSVSQRYIATIMAGNRQQSRFLALVSNVDEYKRALEVAQGSEGTGELQTLKTLDSLDAKIERMKVTIQEFYTSSGLEELYKNIIDAITNIISAANGLPKLFNKFPAQALAVGMSLIMTIKSVLTLIIAEIQLGLERAKGTNTSFLVGLVQQYTQKGQEAGQKFSEGVNNGLKGFLHSKSFVQIANVIGSAAQLIGSTIFTQGLSQYGASTSHGEDVKAVNQMQTGATVSALGSITSGAAMGFATAGPLGALAGGVASLVTQIPTLVTAFGTNTETLARKIELDKKAETKAKEDLSKDKGEVKSLEKALEQLEKLKAAQYDSAEAAREYTDYMNQLGDQYPGLISSINQAGDAIITVESLERKLAEARAATAASTVTAVEKEKTRLEHEKTAYRNLYDNLAPENLHKLSVGQAGFQISKKYGWKLGGTAGFNDPNADSKEYILRAYAMETNNEALLNALGTRDSYTGRRYAVDYFKNKDNEQALMTWVNQTLAADENYASRNDLINQIKTAITAFQDAMPEDKILERLGLDSLDDLSGLSVEELYNKANQAREYARQLFISTSQTIDTVDEALINAQISQGVQTRLNSLAEGTSEQKSQSKKLQDYANLMSFIYSGMGKVLPDEQEMSSLEQWILTHQTEADKLLNIDYSNFIDSSEINLGSLPDQFKSGFVRQFNTIRTEAINLYENQLHNIFGETPSDWLNANNFTNKTLSVIQSNLVKYQSLMNDQQYAMAEAYLNNMEIIYGPEGFGKLTGKQQTQAYDIIKDLDLSDSEALRAAADKFAGMGTNFQGLSEIFITAATRWVTSAATVLQQLSSSAKDTAKSIETSISDMGKVFKYSEALEKAQAIIDAHKSDNLTFDQLYTFDKEAGGYIKKAEAFKYEMADLQQQDYTDIQQAITDYSTTLQPLIDLTKTGAILQYYMPSKKTNDSEQAKNLQKQAKDTFADMLNLDKNSETYSADVDRLWQEYVQMIDAFESTDVELRGTWEEFTQKYLSERGSDLQERLDAIQQMPKKMAKQGLQTYDYTAVISGKGTIQTKETLKALLQNTLGDQFSDTGFSWLWDLLMKGQIDQFNVAMKNLGLEDVQISTGEANRARFEALKSLYDKIASGDVIWDALTEQEQELLNSVDGIQLDASSSAADIGAAADNVWAAVLALIAQGAGTLNEVADSLNDRVNKKYGQTKEEKSYQLLDKYKDGLTADELQKLQGNQELFIKANGELTENAAKYLTYENGKFVAQAGYNVEGVLSFLARTLDFEIVNTTTEYKDAIRNAANQEIKKRDSSNKDKNLQSVFKSIFSGQEGDLINVADIPVGIQQKLRNAGYTISDNILTIGKEQAMNNAALLLEQQAGEDSEFWKDYGLSMQDLSAQTRTLRGKMAKYTAFSEVTGETVSQSAAEALSMALQNTTEFSVVQSLMNDMKFQWDEAAQVWKASADSLKAARTKINTAYAKGQIDREEWLSLGAKLDETAKSIDPKTKQDNALLTILQNYTQVTDEMLATFANEFNIPSTKIQDFVHANDNGTYDIDLVALTSYLQSIGFAYDEAAMTQIQTITDTYLTNIQTAQNYAISGASSLADMEAFKQSYEEMTGTALSPDAFGYDTVLNAFTLDSTYMQKYIQAQKDQLIKLGYTEEFVEAYINDQTESIIQANIQLDSFLNANTSRERNDEASKLITAISSLSNYRDIAMFAAGLTDSVEITKEEYDLAILQILESGGEQAVELLKKIKPEATSEELEAVYNNQINKLRTAQEDLGKGVGETIGAMAARIGEKTGALEVEWIDDGTAVITAVHDMLAAYAAIYRQMKETAGTTTADLNSAFVDMLNAEDAGRTSLLDALKNGNGMSYEALGQIFTSQNKLLEDALLDEATAMKYGLQRDFFGQVRIIDWQKFANTVFDTVDLASLQNNPQYVSAFKAYNDGLIEMNKSVEDSITEEVKSVTGMQRGSQLNLTTLWTKLEQAATDAIEFNFEGYNGNVSNMGHRKIIPDEIMDRYFGDGEGWGTIYGQTFTAKDLVSNVQENVGMVFASLDEAGHAVEDLEGYVTSLVNESMATFGRVSWATIKSLDAAEKNLLLYSKDYDEALSNEEVLDLTNLQAEALHTAEEQAYNIIDVINASLQGYGAKFEDGILTLSENANLLGVAKTLREMVSLAGVEIADNLAEIEDAINEVLKAYSDAIVKGIQGGLTNVEAENLRSYAKDLGITDELGFTKTVDGLKLSNKSARQLYSAIKDIDALQGDIVFAELKESLIESEDQFKSMSSTIAYINQLRKGTAYPDNSKRIDDLEEELALAERINAERSTSEDDSYKFMDNDIPAAQNNPLNYWSNWKDAFDTIRNSTKGGNAKNTIGYQDFYNIITEMGNLASLTEQGITWGERTLHNSEEAANLITEAAGALKNIDGEMVVDLSKIKMNVNTSGIEGMAEDVDDALNVVAQEQIDMLDSLISILEIIVAMEQLKDVDIDFDGELDFSEIFEDWEVKGPDASKFTGEMATVAQSILDYANSLGPDSALYNALDDVRINGYTIREMLKDAADGTRDLDLSVEEYQSVLNALYQASISNDFDTDDVGKSLFQMLSASGVNNVAVDVGKKTYYLTGTNSYVVNWENEDAVNGAIDALNKAGIFGTVNQDNIRGKVQEAIDSMQDGTLEVGTEQYLEVDYAVKLATGTISISTEAMKDGPHQGAFQGRYGNSTFYGTKGEVEAAAREALGLEEQVMNVTIDEACNITATYSQGTATIKYDSTTGKYIDALGQEQDNLKDAINSSIQMGYANQDDAGTYEIKGQKYQVEYNAQLGIAYTFTPDGKIVYEGHNFSDLASLASYIETKTFTADKTKWKTESQTKNRKLEVNGNAQVLTKYKITGTEQEFIYGNTSVKDFNDFKELVGIEELVNNSPGGTLNGTIEGWEASFTYLGQNIQAKMIVKDDDIQFTYTCGDITADSMEGLKAAIAVKQAKELNSDSTNGGEISMDGMTFTYIVDASGQVKVELKNKDEAISDEDAEKTRAALEEQVQKQLSGEANIDLDLKATISAGIVDAVNQLTSLDTSGLGTVASAIIKIANALSSLSAIDVSSQIEQINSLGNTSSNTNSAVDKAKAAIKKLSDRTGQNNKKRRTISISDSEDTDAGAEIVENVSEKLEDHSAATQAAEELGNDVVETTADALTQGSGAVQEGVGTFSEGLTDTLATIDSSYNDLEQKTVSVVDSVKSHWETLANNIKATVELIRQLVQSLQEKISITWSIGSEDANAAGTGSGAGTYGELTDLNNFVSEVMASMKKLEDGSYTIKLPSLTLDTSNTNLDTNSVAQKVVEEVGKSVIDVEGKISKIAVNVAEAAVSTTAILIKVQSEALKMSPISITVPIGQITPDLSSATIGDLGSEEISADSSSVNIGEVKGVVGELSDPLDMTYLPQDLGDQSVKEGTKITISNPINAVVGKLNLDFSETSEVSISEDAEKPEIDVDVAPAEEKISNLQTKIDSLKQNKKIPVIDVDTVNAQTKLEEIIQLLDEIIEKASLIILIDAADETSVTQALLDKIMNTLIIIEGKNNIPLTITLKADNVLSLLDQIAQKLQEIMGNSNIKIDIGANGKTPEGGEGGDDNPTDEDTTTAGETDINGSTVTGETTGGTVKAEETNISDSDVSGEVTGGTVNAAETTISDSDVTGSATGGSVQASDVTLDEASVSGENTEIQVTEQITPEGQIEDLPDIDVTENITPEGQVTDIPEIKTTQTIQTNGGVADIPDFTTIQTIETHGGVGGEATGNIGLAGGNFATMNGLAKAGGTPTLMGELGPELVVSNGKYVVVGQTGPEMVNLANDAIVFNHLQTEQLLTKGMSKERGRAVTNERKAAAFAHGNVHGGPAMASASAALSALKQLRAMWQSLLSATAKDLSSLGGSGGGGGGSGNNGSGDSAGRKSFIEDVERWYNLLQEIAKQEKIINHEETLRNKLEGDLHKNGKAYYESQKTSLAAIRKQLKAQEELNISRREYFNVRRKQLNEDNGPFNQLYEFDKNGQLKYKDVTTIKGSKATSGYAFLADLMAQDTNTGKPKYTAEEQYNILKKAGFEKYMKYDSSGNEITLGGTDSDDGPTEDDYNTYYTSMTQAFWDRVEAQKTEMQTLYDSVAEGEQALLELEQQQNEILEAIYDNQMAVEEAVLTAIEDMKQREIDALQDERDKLEEATGKYIDGLSDALSKEKEMYDNEQDENELNQKRRRLAILQRSGGSAEDIASLSSEIASSERDQYFDLQQQQIDAIQAASDLEIERMDQQIDIMTKQLEFQKEYGLLWGQVYGVMDASAQEITNFILHGNSEFWADSPLKSTQTYQDYMFQAEQWTSFRDDVKLTKDQLKNVDDGTQAIIKALNWDQTRQTADAWSTFNENMKNTHGKDWTKSKYKDRYQEKFNKIFEDTGDRTKAATAASELFQKDNEWVQRENIEEKKFIGTKKNEYVAIDDSKHWHYTYQYEVYTGPNKDYQKNTEKDWYLYSKVKENHKWENGVCSKCGRKKPKEKESGGSGGGYSCNNCSQLCKGALEGGNSSSGCNGNCTAHCKSSCWGSNAPRTGATGGKLIAKERASGGYVGHGIYELGEQGTETVLTAEQTRVLRNNILSNRPSSLISLLRTYNEGFSRMSTPLTGTTTEDNSTNIDKIELTMNVQQIANDYDAKRAGEQALAEMLRIAKKTSANNSIRR